MKNIVLISSFVFITLVSLNAQNVNFSNVTESSFIATSSGIIGTSIVDWNNDGNLDIYVATREGDDYLFTSNGDMTFSESFLTSGFFHSGLSSGALFADFDNDGDLDAFIGMRGSSNYFYEFIGNSFTGRVSQLAEDDLAKAAGIALADYDNDGLLDVYVSNWNAKNILYRNNGNWEFTNETSSSGSGHAGIAMGAGFFDFDNDGDQDLYLTHDGDQGNVLYRNNGDGTFKNVSTLSGTGIKVNGMGVAFGDYDNDGFTDIYTTNLNENTLMRNNSDGTFSDVTLIAGVGDTGMGWGVVFIDYDNDGWLDIYVNNESNFNSTPNVLYKNNADGTFTNMSVEAGLGSEGSGIGLAAGDFNNDGWQDLFLANNSGSELFLNSGGNTNWVTLHLTQINGNRNAVGTRAVVKSGDLSMTRTITIGGSYISQSSLDLHFGLANNTLIDTLILHWSNGAVERHYDLNVNSSYDITEGFAVGVNDESEKFTPSQFQISSAYPNPFNANITIEFILPERNDISVEIYDIMGRKVRTLINRNLLSGKHQLNWNGKTDSGATTGSGIYFVRINLNGSLINRKIIQLK